MINFIYELLFHLNDYLSLFISQHGTAVYLLVFVMIFCETGLFVPFFPGDSLIFTCAAFSAAGLLNIWVSVVIFFAAAFLGDMLNYYFGFALGRRIYRRSSGRGLLKRENIDKAQDFYERHGGKAIILSRFIPLVRQFTPFVAGIGKMTYARFMPLNIVAVTLWVGIASTAGYFFGTIPFVSKHFTEVLMAIVLISLLPAVVAFFKSKLTGKRAGQQD